LKDGVIFLTTICIGIFWQFGNSKVLPPGFRSQVCKASRRQNQKNCYESVTLFSSPDMPYLDVPSWLVMITHYARPKMCSVPGQLAKHPIKAMIPDQEGNYFFLFRSADRHLSNDYLGACRIIFITVFSQPGAEKCPQIHTFSSLCWSFIHVKS
jgi:hypothetical protein